MKNRNSKLRMLIQILCFIFPWQIRRLLLIKLLDFELDPTSRLGFSIIDANRVKLNKFSRIGGLNIFKGLEALELLEEARIGNFNYFSAVPKTALSKFIHCEKRSPSLLLKEGAAITSRHFFDCNDSIEIGAMTIIAGADSQFWTHEIDVLENQQVTKPIKIGNFCYVGTRCTFLAGVSLPSHSVVAAGSLVRGVYANSHRLLAGNPAREKKQFDQASVKYFTRTKSYVD